MKHLCKSCNVCSFLPVQVLPRLYSVEPDTEVGSTKGSSPSVLVLDNLPSRGDLETVITVADSLLLGVKYTYTPVVRCDVEVAAISDYRKAVSRCSVWTNSLLPGRSVILATPMGIDQMKVKGEVTEGEIFRTFFGYVLCIKPLFVLGGSSEFHEYQSKAKRLLKKAGLL